MTVTMLPTPEASRRSPGRKQLAEIIARLDAVRTKTASLREPSATRQAAESELPAAMRAHASAAQEADLSRGTRSQSQATAALEAARKRVLDVRKTIANTPDVSGELAALEAEGVALGLAHKAAHRQALREAIEALTVEYHQHARRAIIAESALAALHRYTTYQIASPMLGVLAANATRLAADAGDAALLSDKVRSELAAYGAQVQAWCERLQGEPDAMTEPMESVAARLPRRAEEISPVESADAA